MKISIFGTGYVGLITGTCLAELGHDVLCADIDAQKVAQLQKGSPTIYEPGLEALLKKNVELSRLSFTADLPQAIHQSDILFIAVGTPPSSTGAPDLSAVFSLAELIGQQMQSKKLIVNKSTVPVGTAANVHALIQKHSKAPFDVCSNPEFLKEGSAIDDFFKADRIIVGSDSPEVRALMTECYTFPSPRQTPPLLFMSAKEAELSKYAANAMLATKISFINELANIAEHFEVDIEEVKKGICSDKRIGPAFLNPGCGYGGSCFPKDVNGLVQTALSAGYKPQLLEAVEAVNQAQKQSLFHKLNAYFNQQLAGKRIAVWGLAFKPGTDDIREASSRTLIDALMNVGAHIQAYDPVAMDAASALYANAERISFFPSAKEALYQADALVICTEWDEFRSFPLSLLQSSLNTPIVIDGRNIYDTDQMKAHGIHYLGIGRGYDDKASISMRSTEYNECD